MVVLQLQYLERTGIIRAAGRQHKISEVRRCKDGFSNAKLLGCDIGGGAEICQVVQPLIRSVWGPEAEATIYNILYKHAQKDSAIRADLLRLHFHDAFVRVRIYFSLNLSFSSSLSHLLTICIPTVHCRICNVAACFQLVEHHAESNSSRPVHCGSIAAGS